jgi:non-homologous end joining protein Ku
VKLAEKPQEAPPVVDLMAALEASLKAARKEKSETPRSRKRKSA